MGRTRDQRLTHPAPTGATRSRTAKAKDYAATNTAGEAALKRSSVTLSSALIGGFVEQYLSYKYDNKVPTPDFHFSMWDACCSEHPNVLCLAPRGHAKSTAITEAYGLAAMLFRVRNYAVIISNTFEQSVEFLRDITTELKENDPLREDFQVARFIKEREDDIIVELRDGHRFRMVAKGAEQKIRGRKWNGTRPNLFLFDDLEDDEQVLTKERRQKFMRWFLNALLPAGSDDCLFRGSATILHFDSLAQNLSTDSEWLTVRFKAHKGFDDFSEVLWPERFSATKLHSIRQKYINQGNRDGYSQEYLNIPIAEGQSLFRPDDLLPMEPKDRDTPMRYYAGWDFAVSKDQASDYTVCVVVGVDSSGRFYVIDVRRDRWESDEIIEEMFAVQRAHNVEVHFAEKGQIEKAIAPFLYKKMRELNYYFNVEPIASTTDKVTRSRPWQAATRAHMVKFDKEAGWWETLFEEMKQFPKGVHDDQVDAQTIIGSQLAIGLMEAPTSKEVQDEEYFELLHRSGAMQEGRNAFTGY